MTTFSVHYLDEEGTKHEADVEAENPRAAEEVVRNNRAGQRLIMKKTKVVK